VALFGNDRKPPSVGEHVEVSERSIRTRDDLAGDLATLGVRPGDTLLVHSSLRRLGYVPGGAVAVVEALLAAVGPVGTLVVPTQTGDNSDPSGWSRPPVPPEWWPVIREHTPGFDPRVTPSQHMGAIPEVVRTWPGALRSSHPQTSFAALGPRAEEIVAVHDLDCQLGDRSPLGALGSLGARVLLLGAGFDSCTAFHLAEYQVAGQPRIWHGAAVRTETGRAWVTFEDLDLDEDDFPEIGAALVEAGRVSSGAVGDADAHLFALGEGVAFAARWMAANRASAGS
jgi:aminoglycoside 3-N-acetyltransferase